MSDTGAPTTMRRKAGAGRPSSPVTAMTVTKAVRLSVSRAAARIDGLEATATSVDEADTGRDALVASLPEDALYARLEGPGGRCGLAVADGGVIGAVLEQIATGRVSQRAADPRRPTRTDAVILADFLDGVLSVQDELLVKMQAGPAWSGFRFAAAVSDPRALEMILPDGIYETATVEISFADGAKTGRLIFAFPEHAVSTGPQAGGGPAIDAVVAPARAVIAATLHRLRVPLAALNRWSVGDTITLPRSALENVTLSGIDGRTVATAKLGQAEGYRAVRVHPPEHGAAAAVPPAMPQALPAAAPPLAEPGAEVTTTGEDRLSIAASDDLPAGG